MNNNTDIRAACQNTARNPYVNGDSRVCEREAFEDISQSSKIAEAGKGDISDTRCNLFGPTSRYRRD